MKLRHIISAYQFDKKTLEEIFTLFKKIKAQKYKKNHLAGKIMATLFYEPSTRTRLSFESAMLRLGGGVISTESASEFSSAAKGETLEDTIRVVNHYCDVIVIRHYNEGASETASRYSKVPVINAGDGKGEHPTQALLDLYTIFSKFKRRDFTIAMVGDLKNGRTIHSLCPLLSHYPKVKIIFISHKALSAPLTLNEFLKQKRINFEETENFKDVSQADVVYQTRIQKGRFKNASDYQKYFGRYIIDKNILKILKKNAVIMHPLPRVNEITQEVDIDKRAIYFEEAQNGLYTRMALLVYLFSSRL